jgi:hypothetical protein
MVSSGACILITNAGGTIVAKGAVSSFGSDQVTINWITTPSSAFELVIEAFGGTDLTVGAGTFAPSTSSNGDVTVESGINFSANNWIGFFGLTDQTASETSGNDALLSFGAAVGTATDGTAQGSSTYSEDDNNANGVPDPRIVGNAVLEAVDNTKTLVYSLRAQAETTTGLTVRTIQGSGLPAASTIAIYLILEVGTTHGTFAGLKARPTATGNWAVTGMGFEPDYAGIAWIHDVAAEAVGFGHSSFIGTGNGKECSAGFFADDGAATTLCGSLTRNGKSLDIRDASATTTVEIEATWSTFDTGGFTLNVATFGTSGTQDWLVWGIEKPSAAAITITADAGSYTWTGTAATLLFDQAITAASASYLWTGTAADMFFNPAIIAGPASYLWTGTAMTPLYSQVLVAAGGSYLWTGTSADLLLSQVLVADPASYLWTGSAAGLQKGFRLTADPASYLWTGSPATLLFAGLLTAEPASYLWTGSAATLNKGFLIQALPGSYLWTGQDTGLLYSPVLVAAPAEYLWTGADIATLYSPVLVAAAASYLWTGQDATLTQTMADTLVAEPGSYLWTGSSATLVYTGGTVIVSGITLRRRRRI